MSRGIDLKILLPVPPRIVGRVAGIIEGHCDRLGSPFSYLFPLSPNEKEAIGDARVDSYFSFLSFQSDYENSTHASSRLSLGV